MGDEGRIGGLLNHRSLGAAFLLAYFNTIPGWIGSFFDIPAHDYRSLSFALLILVLLVSVEALDVLFVVRDEQ